MNHILIFIISFKNSFSCICSRRYYRHGAPDIYLLLNILLNNKRLFNVFVLKLYFISGYKKLVLYYLKHYMHWNTYDKDICESKHKWQYTFILLKPIKNLIVRLLSIVLLINLISLGFLSSWDAYKKKKKKKMNVINDAVGRLLLVNEWSNIFRDCKWEIYHREITVKSFDIIFVAKIKGQLYKQTK